MDAVYEELDEAKAEIVKIREQYRVQVELAESLKRAHNDQIQKTNYANSKLERLAQDLNEKEDEIFIAKQKNEELNTKLMEKESIIKHLSSAHDKLRVDCREKLQKCEEENKILGLSLDNANDKNMDQERQICSLKEEIEGVKRVLTASQKKCSETRNQAKDLKELGGKEEDVFFRLEEENRKFEDQLKWKKEQFGHLEEAHEKLRREFRMKEKEWEKEKAALLHDISSLQMNLESQTRISQSFQNRLEMCNQALAHAESKRKLLEVQLLETRTSFDNVCAECEEAKSELENLTSQRDREIANLRGSLGTREILYREMEYQFKKVEQEKQELMASLKELQEAQIHEAGKFSSSSKLQKKLRSLEEVHKECSTNLKAKESEWHSQMEKLTTELKFCNSALKSKDVTLNELKIELEACDSLILKLELMNQETSLMLLILKSQFSEAQLRLADNHAYMERKNECMEEKVSGLVEQLEAKKAALNRFQKDLEDEREKVVVFSKRVQTLEELQFPLQKELERLEEMLKESSTCQLRSEEQVLQVQCDLNKVRDALDRTNEELNEKFCEVNEVEFEMQIWKSKAEQLEANLKENHQMRREMEASLLAQTEMEVNLKQEKESLGHQLEEREKEIDGLQKKLIGVNERIEVEDIMNREKLVGRSFQNGELNHKELNSIEQEWVKDEFQGAVLAQVEAEKNHGHEKQTLHQIVEEKDQRIYNLQQLVASLETEFESSTTCFSSRLSHMQEEMNIVRETWEKIKIAEVLKEIEIQEKNLMIVELENDLNNLLKSMEKQEETLFNSENKIQELEAALARKQVEVHKMELGLEGGRLRSSDKTLKKLNQEKAAMLEDIAELSSENKSLVKTMEYLSDRIQQLSSEDILLNANLGKIVQKLEIDRLEIGLNDDDGDLKENNDMNSFSSPLIKKLEAIYDERSPLKALNN